LNRNFDSIHCPALASFLHRASQRIVYGTREQDDKVITQFIAAASGPIPSFVASPVSFRFVLRFSAAQRIMQLPISCDFM